MYNVEARGTLYLQHNPSTKKERKEKKRKTHENIYVCMPTDGLDGGMEIGDGDW
jgi:hypothetical protein